jgi:L-aminopeptidase/D-esterase-like protein
MGYRACQAAGPHPPRQGNAGAGMGCTVGKCLGPHQGMKSGLGTASAVLAGDLVVGALVAVNAWGDVVDPAANQIVAGARHPGGPPGFADTLAVLRDWPGDQQPGFGPAQDASTVIGVVATNARLTREQATKVAQMAHDGLARVIRPAHTMFDGDTLFALAVGGHPAEVNPIGAFAAEVVAQAILNAVWAAESAGGWPAASSLKG